MRFSDQTDVRQGDGSGPILNVPGVVLWSVAVLAAVHLLMVWGGEPWLSWAYDELALSPVNFADGGGQPRHAWTLLSYMLLHADWMHLLFNSLWLLIFGTPVARYLGSARFVALCLVSGLAGGLASLTLYWGEPVVIIGASGAVSGLIAAAIPIMYGQRVPGGVRPLSFNGLLHAPQALLFMVVWLLITLFAGGTGWTGQSFGAGTAIAWEAHVGGFLGGLLAFYVLAPRLRQ
jgi:membrane associated rhomboid family serine protease